MTTYPKVYNENLIYTTKTTVVPDFIQVVQNYKSWYENKEDEKYIGGCKNTRCMYCTVLLFFLFLFFLGYQGFFVTHHRFFCFFFYISFYIYFRFVRAVRYETFVYRNTCILNRPKHNLIYSLIL